MCLRITEVSTWLAFYMAAQPCQQELSLLPFPFTETASSSLKVTLLFPLTFIYLFVILQGEKKLTNVFVIFYPVIIFSSMQISLVNIYSWTFSKAPFLKGEKKINKKGCVSFSFKATMNGFQKLQRDWGVYNIRAGACSSMKSVIIMLLNNSNLSQPELLWVVKHFPISVSKVWVKQSAVAASNFLVVTKWPVHLSHTNPALAILEFRGSQPWLEITLRDVENLPHDLYFRCKMQMYLDQCPSLSRCTEAVVKLGVVHPQKAAAKPHFKQ